MHPIYSSCEVYKNTKEMLALGKNGTLAAHTCGWISSLVYLNPCTNGATIMQNWWDLEKWDYSCVWVIAFSWCSVWLLNTLLCILIYYMLSSTPICKCHRRIINFFFKIESQTMIQFNIIDGYLSSHMIESILFN